MRARLSLLLAAAIAGSPAIAHQIEAPRPAFAKDRYKIPHQVFVLDNGLRLVVHEDHAVPIVAVNVWYHVGSKNEKKGRTGFARARSCWRRHACSSMSAAVPRCPTCLACMTFLFSITGPCSNSTACLST